MCSKKKTGGLAGVSADQTAICTVGKEGIGLNYRGYSIYDVAEHATFEEVAYLLLDGALPTRDQLTDYQKQLMGLRKLPDAIKPALEALPASAHPMDVLRTGVSALGCLEPEDDPAKQHEVAMRLLGVMPGMVMYWYHFSHNGNRIETETDQPTLAGHLLEMLLGQPPKELHERAMDVSLILYAEHEFNASTFAARVTTSTLSDFYAAITSAIGTLRGPLHGGANEAALDLIEKFSDAESAEAGIMEMLAKKEKIMGFGHRVYSICDPRSEVIESWARRLAEDVGDTHILPIADSIAGTMKREKNLFTNLDFYSAPAYHYMGLPTPLFTPVFAFSRVTGWGAHIFEQRVDNRLIRPGADYVGPEPRPYVAIEDR